MKRKMLIGIVLVALLTAGYWLWTEYRMPTPVQPATKPTKPAMVSASNITPPKPAPVPVNTAKMAVIVGRPKPAASYSTISDWSAVQIIVDPQLGYEQRMRAINALSPHLTDMDWSMLKNFLLKPDSLDQIQLGQVLKNSLMDALCTLNPPPPGLGNVLISLYRDHQQNEVVRDYAVQHLAAYYEQMALQSDGAQEEQKVRGVLWEATVETSDTIGGTALLALTRLSQEYGADFDQARIGSTALQLADASDAGELTHITAFQVCAQLGVTNALPIVLQAAQNGETIPVRISAIGALGLLGGQDQIAFLNSIFNGPEDRLKPAARHALEEITARNKLLANQK